MSTPFDSGPVITRDPVQDDSVLRDALRAFTVRESAYRQRYLQSRYSHGFDGYSHHGQVDSTHQAPDDMLHSFVFSDFHPEQAYPAEFQPFIARQWQPLTKALSAVQQRLLEPLVDGAAAELFRTSCGHMMTANYYPPATQFSRPAAGGLRLGEHPDVSLLTVFPFGLDGGFEYQDAKGHWHALAATERMVVFPGYLLAWLSGGEIPALNHRVGLAAQRSQERFSFGVFSLPRPGTRLTRVVPGTGGATQVLPFEAYVQEYLSLWDY